MVRETPEGRPDIVPTVSWLHTLPPVIAGASLGWWRRHAPCRIAGGMVAGASVLVAAAAAVLTQHWFVFNYCGAGDGRERATELPVALIAIGLIGSLLGMIGAGGDWRRVTAAQSEGKYNHAR